MYDLLQSEEMAEEIKLPKMVQPTRVRQDLKCVRTRPESIRDTGEMKKERSEMDTGAARSPKDTTKEENSI